MAYELLAVKMHIKVILIKTTPKSFKRIPLEKTNEIQYMILLVVYYVKYYKYFTYWKICSLNLASTFDKKQMWGVCLSESVFSFT